MVQAGGSGANRLQENLLPEMRWCETGFAHQFINNLRCVSIGQTKFCQAPLIIQHSSANVRQNMPALLARIEQNNHRPAVELCCIVQKAFRHQGAGQIVIINSSDKMVQSVKFLADAYGLPIQ